MKTYTMEEIVEAWEQKAELELPRDKNNTKLLTYENETCGDSVSIFVEIEDNIIINSYMEGAGCVLSQGCAVLICRDVVGKTVEEAKDLDFFIDFEITPMRKKCVVLALKALETL